MKKLKEVAGMLAFTLFFGLITGVLVSEYAKEYDLYSATKTEAIVTEKVGEKGLFTPPSYFVRVELADGEQSEDLHRISRRQMEKLEPGDKVSGLSISGFSTMYDLLYDSLFFAGAIMLFGFMTLLGVIVLITEIPPIDRFLMERTFLGRPSKGSGMKILTVTMAVFVYFSGRFLYNLFFKAVPFFKTKTEAFILDSYSYVTYRRHEDSVHQFTVAFENAEGENVVAIKHVTSHTYHDYSMGDKLPISYRDSNPYDFFVDRYTFSDFLQALFYREFYVYTVLLAVVLFTGYALFNRKRSKAKDHAG